MQPAAAFVCSTDEEKTFCLAVQTWFSFRTLLVFNIPSNLKLNGSIIATTLTLAEADVVELLDEELAAGVGVATKVTGTTH